MVAERTNLPVPPTALIGRAEDVANLRDMLTAPGTRLVTLTGPPGVGKTRLAVASAAAVADQFPGATVWVDLGPVRDPQLAMAEIERAFDVNRDSTGSALNRLPIAISGQDVLLVLDNFEHLLAAAAQLGRLLAASPRLRVLATSRERLHLAAEREYAVPPLPMPSELQVGDLGRLAANPAVELLLARAPRQIALTRNTARSLAEICVRLDGLPLAIELAAARLRVFTPGELAYRLDHRMAVLTGGSRDAPGRHRDLRAAITWSHELLPAAERAVFRRLSVFVGAWTIAAAEVVCADDEADARPARVSTAAVADAVESLLDKSLIQRVHGADRDARFTMLVSLREFAAEQLDQHDEVADTQSRHARYFADGARRWETAIGAEDESVMWPLVDDMRGDLVAAFAHSRTAGSALDHVPLEDVLWLAAGLGWYAYTRGSLAEAAGLIDFVFAVAADDRSSSDARAAALGAAGAVAFGLGDLASADRGLSQAAALSDARGDRRRLALVSAILGHVARGYGRFDDAAANYATARSIYEQLGSARGRAWAAHDLGLLANEQGDLAGAEAQLREALRLLAPLDYDWARAVSACALARVLLLTGNVDEPAGLLATALALHEGVGDGRGIAQCLETLAELAFARGAAATAGRLLGAASAQRGAVAAGLTETEQARLARLDAALVAALGRDGADHEKHAGRTMPANAAIALAAGVAAAGRLTEDRGAALTARQLEVAALVAAGRTNRQIGRALGITEKTAEVHVRNLMQRLQAPSRAGVAAWATAHGLLPAP